MPTGLAPQIGRDALPRADSQGRAFVHRVARVFTVAFCVIALAGCNCIIRSNFTQTAHSKNVTESKKFIGSKSRTPTREAPLISQTVDNKITESNKFSEAKSRMLIPLPEAPLLSPQPEPSCEVETTGTNADERQKLDYERQCYRHAEMIIRSRLQLLQGSVDKIISVIKGTRIPLPAAPLLSPQPEPSCEFGTAQSNVDERQKLDYERQCYRHAEMIVRSRMQLLQGSVDKIISAIQRSQRGGP